MKNDRIIVEVRLDSQPDNQQNQVIDFYLRSADGKSYGKSYLLSLPFSIGVWKYFKNGRAVSEIMAFRAWNKNPRLDKTIVRLPSMIRYIKREQEQQRCA